MGTKKQTKTELAKTYNKVIFGFADRYTGNKLKEFYLKHTGREVDFNSIQHYRDGFKLLVFDLPLGKFIQVGITAASCAPKDVLRFGGSVNELIYWYEHDYLGLPVDQTEKTEEIMSVTICTKEGRLITIKNDGDGSFDEKIERVKEKNGL